MVNRMLYSIILNMLLTPNLLPIRPPSLAAVLTRVKLILSLFPALLQGFHCLLSSLTQPPLSPCFCFSHRYLSWLPSHGAISKG